MDIGQNINNLMKEAQKMQERMQEAQKELSNTTRVGEAGGGAIKIEMRCDHYATNCDIPNPAIIEGDVEMLQDLIVAAINDAVRKIDKVTKEKISQLTAGLNIPTDFMKDKKEGEQE